jgi:hypothetical protein
VGVTSVTRFGEVRTPLLGRAQCVLISVSRRRPGGRSTHSVTDMSRRIRVAANEFPEAAGSPAREASCTSDMIEAAAPSGLAERVEFSGLGPVLIFSLNHDELRSPSQWAQINLECLQRRKRRGGTGLPAWGQSNDRPVNKRRSIAALIISGGLPSEGQAKAAKRQG